MRHSAAVHQPYEYIAARSMHGSSHGLPGFHLDVANNPGMRGQPKPSGCGRLSASCALVHVALPASVGLGLGFVVARVDPRVTPSHQRWGVMPCSTMLSTTMVMPDCAAKHGLRFVQAVRQRIGKVVQRADPANADPADEDAPWLWGAGADHADCDRQWPHQHEQRGREDHALPAPITSAGDSYQQDQCRSDQALQRVAERQRVGHQHPHRCGRLVGIFGIEPVAIDQSLGGRVVVVVVCSSSRKNWGAESVKPRAVRRCAGQHRQRTRPESRRPKSPRRPHRPAPSGPRQGNRSAKRLGKRLDPRAEQSHQPAQAESQRQAGGERPQYAQTQPVPPCSALNGAGALIIISASSRNGNAKPSFSPASPVSATRISSASLASSTATMLASTGSVGAIIAPINNAMPQGRPIQKWVIAATAATVSNMAGNANRAASRQAESLNGKRSFRPLMNSETTKAISVISASQLL